MDFNSDHPLFRRFYTKFLHLLRRTFLYELEEERDINIPLAEFLAGNKRCIVYKAEKLLFWLYAKR